MPCPLLQLVLTAGLTALAPPATALDAGMRELVTTDLTRTPVQVVWLDQNQLVARSPSGAEVRRPLSDVIALLPLRGDDAPVALSSAPAPAVPARTPAGASPGQGPTRPLTTTPTAPSTGELRTTAGAVLPGTLLGVEAAAGQGEEPTIAWSSPSLGTLRTPLDAIRAIVLRSGAGPALDARALNARTPGADDSAGLLNGDTLAGFATLRPGPPPGLEIEQANAVPLSVPLTRVAWLMLANELEAPKTGQAWIWLSDGSVTPVASLRIAREGAVGITLAGDDPASPRPLDLDALRAWSPDRSRAVALAQLPRSTLATDPQRRFTPPARVRSGGSPAPLDAPDLELPGPMGVRIELPRGARRVGGEALLPAGARVWGTCELIILEGEQELFRTRLEGTAPIATFNVELRQAGAAPLVIRLEDAGDGPIEDRVILRSVLVTLGAP